MARAKAKANFQILDNIKNLFDPSTARRVGTTVVKGIKESTARGRSPVKGHGRFEAYAVQRSDAAGNYPVGARSRSGEPINKSRRPVNLRLEGTMMDAISWQKKGRDSVNIGLSGASDGDLLTIANAHNDGVPEKNIPQRKFIANKPGEQYSLTIQRAIRRVFELRLNNLIRRSNRRR